MIKGKMREQTSEKEYRLLDCDSSSTLKKFYDSPMDYYKKYITGEEDDKESTSALIGNLVHTCLLEGPEVMEEKYYLSTCPETPTEKMLDFCLALFKHTKLNCTEDGTITTAFENLLIEAHRESGYKWGLDRVLKEFSGKNPEIYYNELRQAWGQRKRIVTAKDLSLAESISDYARQDSISGPVVTKQSDSYHDVYKELQIDNFEIDGLPLKAMIDKLVVSHLESTIQPQDFKVVWDPTRFYNEYYLQRKSFLQTFVYDKAVRHIASVIAPGYKILPIQFVTIDSTMKQQSIIYQTTEEDLYDAYHGFYERGWYYRGVGEIIEDLKFHKETNFWKTPRRVYMSDGIVPLKEKRA